MRKIEGRKIAVFGGSGSIGLATCLELARRGAEVHAFARGKVGLRALKESDETGRIHTYIADVATVGTREYDMAGGKTDGVVYAVGNCPPRQFDERTKYPLWMLESLKLREELTAHVVGLHAVFKAFSPMMGGSGDFVVLSSAATRMPGTVKPPEWLHLGHYCTAKAAQDMLVAWMRHELPRGQRIHRLAPRAVNTRFVEGSRHLQSPKLSVAAVVAEIIACFESDVTVDTVLPRPGIEGVVR